MKTAALLLALALGVAGVCAQDREQLERRVQSVGTLIESSSAARQIESSGDAAARAKRDTAQAAVKRIEAVIAQSAR